MLQQKIPEYFLNQNEDHLIKKDIILVNESNNNREYFTKVPLLITNDNKFSFSELINSLKAQTSGLTRSILYLQTSQNTYSLVGADPFSKTKYIDYGMIRDKETLVIKYKQVQQLNKLSGQQIKENDSDSDDVDLDDKYSLKPREKRVKERKIIYVREKVNLWRSYYEQGYYQDGKIVKVNLDTSANMVGLSRKTLDDYYAILRKAESLGFDFMYYQEKEKMGFLRKFVKDYEKKSDKNGDKNQNSAEKPKKLQKYVIQNIQQTIIQQKSNICAPNTTSSVETQSQSQKIDQNLLSEMIETARSASPQNMSEDEADKKSQQSKMSIENIVEKIENLDYNQYSDIDQFLFLDDPQKMKNRFSDASPNTSLTMN